MKLKKIVCIGLAAAMTASSVLYGNAAAGANNKETAVAAAETVAAAEVSEEKLTGDAAEALTEDAADDASAAAGQEEIAREDVSVTWDDSRVYKDLTLGRFKTITTYGVKGYEDVPFISAADYLNILCEGREKTETKDGVMTVTVNGTKAVIDSYADTVFFENPAGFRSPGEVEGAVVDETEYNVIMGSVKNKSVQEQAEPLTISLKDYHMPAIAWEDTVILPFLALQNTFGSVCMSNVLAYNGKDYFNAFKANEFAIDPEHKGAKESPYMKAVYSGPFSQKKETTQAYADYGYYSVCLQLDLTFGHKEEKNITTFDDYFTRLHAKESMSSTNPSSAMLAELLLFNYLFDSGHDTLMSDKNVFGAEMKKDLSGMDGLAEDVVNSQKEKELFQGQTEEDAGTDIIAANALIGAFREKGFRIPEVIPLMFWSSYMSSMEPEDYGEERLDYAGDTAVIYFTSFKDDTTKRDPSYYLDPIKEEDAEESNFAFFYRCFEDIKQHDEVKNVVINISNNGGGSAAGLISILGFLSEDGEVCFTNKDMMAGNYREEWYHIDTNLDGVADDQDGFGGQYDFYIMCSGSSYSCGNALPYFAQQNGLAKVIGTRPGGGDCVIGYFIDAYGRCAVYSGMLKLGYDDGNGFVSNEKAVTLDLNMMPSFWDIGTVPWYDPEGIADAVHQYQKGTRELSYTEKEESEKISELLEGFLEKIVKKAEEQRAKEAGEQPEVGEEQTEAVEEQSEAGEQAEAGK